MSIVRVFLCLLLAVLVACEGDKPEAPQPPESAREEIQVPVVVPPPVAVPQAVEPAPAAPPAATPEPAPPAAPQPPVAAPAPRAAAPAAAKPAAPLDLSLPDELLERLPGEEPLLEVVEPQPLLPPLFGDKAQEPQSFELGGRLISNEGPAAADEDSWHELQGAELELRFRR